MTYEIYEEFFPDVEKILNRIIKKCMANGNDFHFEVVGETIKEKENLDGTKDFYKFFVVSVEGTAKIDNWECVAVLDIRDEGNIIRRINNEMEIPEKFRFSKNICEHCNTVRPRKNLYVIHNVETNEWKQVGGTCLRLYTNGLNMEYVTAYMDGITTLEESDGYIGMGSKKMYETESIIARAMEVIDKIGYFNSNSDLPTKSLVSWFCSQKDTYDVVREINNELRIGKYDFRFESKDFYKDGTNERVEKIVDYYKNLTDDSEFVHNVQIILSSDYCSNKDFGFLSYLPEGYNKYIQKEQKRIEREKKSADSEYFGEIGKRYKKVKILSVSDIASWESIYGVTYVYRIDIEGGYSLTWKTSNAVYLERNEEYGTIDFSVKEHKEYKGEKQTEVTRCKIAKVEKIIDKKEVVNNDEIWECI